MYTNIYKDDMIQMNEFDCDIKTISLTLYVVDVSIDVFVIDLFLELFNYYTIPSFYYFPYFINVSIVLYFVGESSNILYVRWLN